jgi:hypothetical protein
MNTTKILALAMLSLVAAYGCATSDVANDEPESAETEDELILRKGSVDHAAIVEVTTMMLAGGPLDGLLDPYNQEDPFAIRRAPYAGTFAQRLAKFDAIDGTTNWKPEQSAAWVSRVASGNYVVVDTSKPCNFADPHTYLEIERAQMAGREHTTCGGRMPNEDALDVTLNWLIRGPSASALDENAITDGVDQATKRAEATFPYLGEMNGI